MGAFDSVFAACQDQFGQASEGLKGWQPPEGRYSVLLEDISDKEIVGKSGDALAVLNFNLKVLDGEHQDKVIKRALFFSEVDAKADWPSPSMRELAMLASILAGETVKDMQKAVEIVKSSAGAALALAVKFKTANSGKEYTNVYYNDRLDAA